MCEKHSYRSTCAETLPVPDPWLFSSMWLSKDLGSREVKARPYTDFRPARFLGDSTIQVVPLQLPTRESNLESGTRGELAECQQWFASRSARASPQDRYLGSSPSIPHWSAHPGHILEQLRP